MSNNVEATGPNPGKPPKPKFKNRAERNEGYLTDAMKIFGNAQMLNERPDLMTKEEYGVLRKIQTQVLKMLFHKGKSPSRKLSGIMGSKEPLARTKKGAARVTKRMIKQRKSGG